MDGVEENTGAAKDVEEDGIGSAHVKEKSGASWERLWSKVPSEVEMGSIGKCVFESTTVLAIDGANMLASVVCAGSRKLAGVSISVNMPVSVFSAGALLVQKLNSSSRPRSVSPGFILFLFATFLPEFSSTFLHFWMIFRVF